jgi:hypothetical protein
MADTSATPDQPVVVTFRQVEKAIGGQEAIGNLQEVVARDRETPNLEKAAIMAAVGNVLTELRRAEENAGAAVLSTAHSGPAGAMASRLQSLIATGEGSNTTFAPLPSGGLEAKFDTMDWAGWATVLWQKLLNPIPHPMVRPTNHVAAPFPDAGRIAMIGDWGTGLYGAPEIAKSIERDRDPFAMLLHLGDVYYSGTENEVAERFLNLWPKRPGAINRAINSNHEMYSGGFAYFDKILPRFDQQGSYFALQNRHWTLVGLDVAYRDHAIDDEQIDWLEGILAGAGDRKVILLSHHQLYSHFESQGAKLFGHPRFGAILRRKRIFAWYWGHEHRCTLFQAPDPAFGLWGRCIGHGGMPESRRKTRNLPRADGDAFARADWRGTKAASVGGLDLPGCVVLEGPNPFITGEEEKFTPHGYAVLTLDGPTLKEQVMDPNGQVIYENMLVS